MQTTDLQAQLQSALPDLWRYGFALTRNRDAADDLVQDTMERALRKSALWQPTGTPKAWAMTIMLNIFRDQRAKTGRRGPEMALDALHVEPRAPDALGPRLDLADTARALDTLPEDQREALLIVVLGGLSYKEAAESLGLPMGTLMSRLGRARAALRAALGQTATPAKEGALT